MATDCLPETFFFASGVNIKYCQYNYSNLMVGVILLGFPDNVLSMEGAPPPPPPPGENPGSAPALAYVL